VTPDPKAADLPAVDYLHRVRREDRLADKVADHLKQAILNGQLQPGDRLPPERTLGERFGVSRTVIREAIRDLAARSLVDVRSGSGTVVARVGAGSVSETMRLYLLGAAIDPETIDEVRTMLRVHTAGVAAERATADDLRELRQVLDAMIAARAGDAEFHRCVARATHNPLYLLMLDSMGEAAAPAPGPEGRPPPPGHWHEHILACIATRDPAAAREAMRLHLVDSRRLWEHLVTEVGEPAGDRAPGELEPAAE
jgi:GntR family transcriptional repressor for pyruvate dehydrogenase complex